MEKFDGNINITTSRIGNHNGTNEDLKSNFLLIFFDKKFDIYISKKIDASADGWNEIPIKGIFIHLLAFAPSISFPWKAVKINKIIINGKIIFDNP